MRTDTDIKKALLQKLYRLFSIRQRSEKEIRDYLQFHQKEKIENKVIDELVEVLKRQGLVNDLEFAKNWLEARSKKKGLRVIKRELFQKGIDREIIEEVIGGQSMENSELVARKLIDKKLERWKNLPPMELKKKAIDFLLRRGFDYAQVKSIVENTLRKR